MKIVTWNANGKFRDKVQLFDPKSTNILVVQECENTEKSIESYNAAGWKFLWLGENKNKGLGIFVPLNHTIEPLSWEMENCRYFLPVTINQKNIVIGVWAMGGKSKSVSYAGQVSRFLYEYSDKINPEHTMIIGDFNSNSIWDKRHKNANHTNNDARLNQVGLRSLYHSKKNELQGSETEPTFFMYRKPDKPYHIDFAYLPEKYLEGASIDIGSNENWLKYSDHMPIFICLSSDVSERS